MQLGDAHVHRVYVKRAPLQQHVGKATGGRAHVQAYQAVHIHIKDLQRLLQLEAAPADVGVGVADDREDVRFGDLAGRLVDGRAVNGGQSLPDQRLRTLPTGDEAPRHKRGVRAHGFIRHDRFILQMLPILAIYS